MKILYVKLFYLYLFFFLLIFVTDKITTSEFGSLQLSKEEKDLIIGKKKLYAYLGRELSDIPEIIEAMRDKTQGMYQLHNHMAIGYKISLHNKVIEILNDALSFLDSDSIVKELAKKLKKNIKKIENGELDIEVVEKIVKGEEKEEERDNIHLTVGGSLINIKEEAPSSVDILRYLTEFIEINNDTIIEKDRDKSGTGHDIIEIKKQGLESSKDSSLVIEFNDLLRNNNLDKKDFNEIRASSMRIKSLASELISSKEDADIEPQDGLIELQKWDSALYR